ncbi:MAG: dUTP diphosphatase [Acidobacteriota bacterium]
MELKVKRIHPEANIPGYSLPQDAGMDLFSSIDIDIKPREIKAIPTGIQVAVPAGYVGLIWDKSGLSLEGLHRLAGVIDSGYRGEVKVVMVNLGNKVFPIKKGMKIAQMLVQPISSVKVVEVDRLEETPRGDKGFGSTGRF